MEDTVRLKNDFFSKCEILLGEESFSEEYVVRRYGAYLANTANKDTHNVGIVLHTGSVVFNALSIAFAAVTDLIMSNTDSELIVRSLNRGDIVLYGKDKKERYRFDSITVSPVDHNTECALLVQDKTKAKGGQPDYNWVPIKNWRFITPYYGTSTSMSGLGIKKKTKARERFFKEVLGYSEQDIPGITDISTVILMQKSEADYILKNLKFRFGETTLPLLELITASYYTENNEVQYGHNPEKAEPVLKITEKANVAGDLVRKKGGNRCAGLLILGSTVIKRNETQLPALIKRKSLPYVFLLTHIDSPEAYQQFQLYENAEIFACTKDFLLSNSKPVQKTGFLTNELGRQVDAIIDRKIDPITLPGFLSHKDYRIFRKSLLVIKKSDYESDDKNNFVIQAFSLMNLFSTAPFTMPILEKCIEEGTAKIVSPQERLLQLKEIQQTLPVYLAESAKKAIEITENAYLALSENSQKAELLQGIIKSNCEKRIALVVPKAYYSPVLQWCGVGTWMRRNGQLDIYTANKFDQSGAYDMILVLGDYSGSKFDTYRTKAAKTIIPLLYDFESGIFKYNMKNAEQKEKEYDRRSAFDYPIEEEFDQPDYGEDESEDAIREEAETQEEIDEFVKKITVPLHLHQWYDSPGSTSGDGMSEISTVVSFESGEKAFLTKMYKAYVLDEANNDVKEVSPREISEGDTLVFTRSNAKSHDIVDELLTKLIEGKKLDKTVEKDYDLSKSWKRALWEYMDKTTSSEKQIAEQMIQNGVSVQENTIRTWLDPDSHTVGPRDKESLEQIALLTENNQMLNECDAIFRACATIRKIRIQILKGIGESIINKLKGKQPKEGSFLADVYSRIDNLADYLTVDSVLEYEGRIQTNLVNRPLKYKEQ